MNNYLQYFNSDSVTLPRKFQQKFCMKNQCIYNLISYRIHVPRCTLTHLFWHFMYTYTYAIQYNSWTIQKLSKMFVTYVQYIR